MSRRAILVIAAVLVAAVSTALLAIYVRGAEARADARSDLVGVVVAAEAIAPGDTVAEAQAAGAFIEQARPESDVPEGAFGDLAQLADRSDEQFTTGVVENEIILSSQLSETQQSDLGIPPNQLAVAVQLDDSARVAGNIMSGSEVTLYATLSGAETRVLLDRAKVLSIGTEGSEDGTLVTLALTQEDAQRVVHAQANGTLYAALLGPDYQPSSIPPTTNENLFQGQP